MVRSASTGTGTALAKSAASSSFARDVTCYLEGGEGARLIHAKLAQLGELEERQEKRQYFPRLRLAWKDVLPVRVRPNREQRAHDAYGPVDVQRSGHDIVYMRLPS